MRWNGEKSHSIFVSRRIGKSYLLSCPRTHDTVHNKMSILQILIQISRSKSKFAIEINFFPSLAVFDTKNMWNTFGDARNRERMNQMTTRKRLTVTINKFDMKRDRGANVRCLHSSSTHTKRMCWRAINFFWLVFIIWFNAIFGQNGNNLHGW